MKEPATVIIAPTAIKSELVGFMAILIMPKSGYRIGKTLCYLFNLNIKVTDMFGLGSANVSGYLFG